MGKFGMYGKDTLYEKVSTVYYTLEYSRDNWKLANHTVLEKQTPAIHKVEPFHPDYFLWVYNKVGAPYGWYMMNEYSPYALQEYLKDKNKRFYICGNQVDPYGFCVARYSELEEGLTNICYFGMLPGYTGRGWGKKFLHGVFDDLFTHHSKKIWLYTTSRDHPNALNAYKSAGMSLVGVTKEEEYIPHNCIMGGKYD